MATQAYLKHNFHNDVRAFMRQRNGFEVVTTAASAKAADMTVFETQVVSDGSAAARTLNLSVTGNVLGQKKLVTFKTRANASDTVLLQAASLVQNDNTTAVTSLTLSAAAQFALLEWNGTKYRIIYTSGAIS